MDSLRKPSPTTHSSRPPGVFVLDDEPVNPAVVSSAPSAPRVTRSKTRRWWSRLLFAGAWILLFLGLTGSGLVFFAGFTLTDALHFDNRELSFFQSLRETGKSLFQKAVPLKGEREGRVNVLLLGRAGEKYPGKNLTDTVMILSVDTRAKRSALLSLPRDLFVPIPGTDLSTKVNALYQYGLSSGEGTRPVRESVSAVTGLPLPYVAVIDFEGFERAIDALGGITVEVPRDIYDPRYPGKNYSYETFELKAGWQKLDGATALKYARERHDDPEGDFGRAKRQQQILQAVAERAFALPTFLNPFTLHAFLERLGESVTTTIEPGELRRFLELAGTIDHKNVTTVVVDAWKRESLLRVDHIDTPSGRVFILVPRDGTWVEVRDTAAHLFDPERNVRRQEKIESERAVIRIYTAPRTLEAGQRFRAALAQEFPGSEVTLSPVSALNKSPETAIILDRTDLGKPFTLDALMKRFDVDKVEVLPFTPPSSAKPADLVVVFTRSIFTPSSSLSDEPALNEYDFQEPLQPQPAKVSR